MNRLSLEVLCKVVVQIIGNGPNVI